MVRHAIRAVFHTFTIKMYFDEECVYRRHEGNGNAVYQGTCPFARKKTFWWMLKAVSQATQTLRIVTDLLLFTNT